MTAKIINKLICKLIGHKWETSLCASNLVCRDSKGNDISDKFVLLQPLQCSRCNLYKPTRFQYKAVPFLQGTK